MTRDEGGPRLTWELTERDISDALSEAMCEVAREPRTSLWRSFWDRLYSDGEPAPPWPFDDEEPPHLTAAPSLPAGDEGREALAVKVWVCEGCGYNYAPGIEHYRRGDNDGGDLELCPGPSEQKVMVPLDEHGATVHALAVTMRRSISQMEDLRDAHAALDEAGAPGGSWHAGRRIRALRASLSSPLPTSARANPGVESTDSPSQQGSTPEQSSPLPGAGDGYGGAIIWVQGGGDARPATVITSTVRLEEGESYCFVGSPLPGVDDDPVARVRAKAPGVIGRALLALREGNADEARRILDEHAAAVSEAHGPRPQDVTAPLPGDAQETER